MAGFVHSMADALTSAGGRLVVRALTPSTPETIDFGTDLVHLSHNMTAALLLALATLLLLAGFRAIKPIVTLCGAFIGTTLARALFRSLASVSIESDAAGGASSHDLLYVAGFVGAVVGALLTYYLFHVGLFLVGAGAGLLFGSLLVQYAAAFVVTLSAHELIRYVIIVGTALLMGTLALMFNKLFLVPSTAFLGSFLAVSSLDHFRGGPLAFEHFGWSVRAPGVSNVTLSSDTLLSASSSLNQVSHVIADFRCRDDLVCFAMLLLWCVLFAVGVLFQFAADRMICCCRRGGAAAVVSRTRTPFKRRLSDEESASQPSAARRAAALEGAHHRSGTAFSGEVKATTASVESETASTDPTRMDLMLRRKKAELALLEAQVVYAETLAATAGKND